MVPGVLLSGSPWPGSFPVYEAPCLAPSEARPSPPAMLDGCSPRPPDARCPPRPHTRRAAFLSLEPSVSPNLMPPVFPTDPGLSFPDLPGFKQERMRKGDSAVAEKWPLTDTTKAPELEDPPPRRWPRRRKSRVRASAKRLTTFPREPRGAAWRQLFLSADVLAGSGVLAPSPIAVTRWSPASSPIRPCGLPSPVWG